MIMFSVNNSKKNCYDNFDDVDDNVNNTNKNFNDNFDDGDNDNI